MSPGAPFQQPLSAPPAPTAPPPPTPDSRLPYPPPPGLSGPAPLSAPPASWPADPQSAPPPAAAQAPPGQPPMSDTERMLAPQGLFSSPQPKPFDWQQPWSVPATAAGQAQQGLPSTLPHGMDALPSAPPAPYPPQPGAPYPQPGQYPPPGGYPPGAGFPPGGGFPPQPQPGAGYPYGPGQYPPPGGQFGPGVPGYPGGPSGARPWDKVAARLKLPKGPLGPVIVGAALVVVIAASVALAIPGGGGGSTPMATTGGSTPTATSSAAAASPAEKQAAVALSGLLPQSGIYHADVNAAVGNVQSCGKDLPKDARILNKSAANRRTLLARLAKLPGRDALPAAMLTDLTKAWQASAQVDSDLAKWAARAASHCHKGNQNDPNLAASAGPETIATNSKQAFAKLWNALARKYGLSTIQGIQL